MHLFPARRGFGRRVGSDVSESAAPGYREGNCAVGNLCISPTWSALPCNADGCATGDDSRSSYYEPRRPAKQTPHCAATRRDGAGRGAGFGARLANGAYHLLHLASRHHPRPATRRARVGLMQRFLSPSAWRVCSSAQIRHRNFIAVVLVLRFNWATRPVVVRGTGAPVPDGRARRRVCRKRGLAWFCRDADTGRRARRAPGGSRGDRRAPGWRR